jgi:hypothetical protein
MGEGMKEVIQSHTPSVLEIDDLDNDSIIGIDSQTNGRGFLCRMGYESGDWVPRSKDHLTIGNRWNLSDADGNPLKYGDIQALCRGLMSREFKIYAFDDVDELLSWLLKGK